MPTGFWVIYIWREKVVNHDTQESSGNYPFSEKETQVIKNELESVKPTVFITIHSGVLGLYTPYGFS